MIWFVLALCLVLFWAVLAFAALYTSGKPAKMPALGERVKSMTREDFRFWFEVVGITVALVTILLLYQQNQQQGAEVRLVQQQLDQQHSIYINTRRAELLEAIYGRRDCESDDIEECPFVSGLRVRTEAAKAFAEVEWGSGVRPDLSGVDLSRAGLYNTDFLNGTNLSGAVLSGTVLARSDLSGARLAGANLRNSYLDSVNLFNAHLGFVNLCDASLTSANLRGALLSGANLRNARLNNADLRNAHLGSADLFGADLREADLRGADLRGANLNDADRLPRAILLGADHLPSAAPCGANLTNADLTNATYTKSTIWPEGFDPEAAGAILVEE